MSVWDITNGPVFDETIWEKEYHTHNPYASSKLGNSDEIRIPIQQQDAYTLPSESYIYIEGRVLKKNGTDPSSIPFINNAMSFLFEEIRYEISGITVDSTKRVGITSTLKNLVSQPMENVNVLQNAGWVAPAKSTLEPSSTGYFEFCIPLKMLLGFAEDYGRIVINVKQELFLLRASTDNDLICAPTGTTAATLEWKLDLQKVVWRVPHVRLSDEHRLTLLKQLDSDRIIALPFRRWEMHEYPILPTSQRHSWTIKTSTQLEKPRYIIFALQTAKKNDILKNCSTFDHCEITNIKLFLNSHFFPYDMINASFMKNKFRVLYDMYSKFQSSYYGKRDSPLLSPADFISTYPIFVIDCSKQNESIKSSTVDIRLEFETAVNIPKDTTAYCLVLHDTIVTYTPLSGTVKTVM